MTVTKIAVYVAHDTSALDTEKLVDLVKNAVGPELDRRGVMFEVRPDGEHEGTLASVVHSLHDGGPVQLATATDEKPNARSMPTQNAVDTGGTWSSTIKT
jgi:hypothetical protein